MFCPGIQRPKIRELPLAVPDNRGNGVPFSSTCAPGSPSTAWEYLIVSAACWVVTYCMVILCYSWWIGKENLVEKRVKEYFYVVLKVLIPSKCFLNQSRYVFLNGVSVCHSMLLRIECQFPFLIYTLPQRMSVFWCGKVQDVLCFLFEMLCGFCHKASWWWIVYRLCK